MAIVNPKAEIKVGSVWTDYSSKVRGEAGIVISNRGLQDQASQASAAQCDFVLNNRDGLFTNRKPDSALYNLFPTGTQVRFSVPAAVSDNYVRVYWPNLVGGFAGTGGSIATADKAVLQITGDLDIRVEVTPDTWRPSGGYTLAGKGQTGSFSWAFYLFADGQLVFDWSSDGTNFNSIYSGNKVPDTSTRLALRATIDVNLGGTQKVITFYTAPSLSGTWTQLGQSTLAGVTSIWNTVASLEAGGVNNHSAYYGWSQLYGKIHGLELYNGIAGTLVAKFDPTSQALDSVSWSDGLGTPNTWNIAGVARVTSDRLRFVGATTRAPLRWTGDNKDAWVPVQALGPLSTLTAQAVINSPIYRNFTKVLSPIGYWPMEAASGALTPDTAGSALTTPTINDISFSGATPTGLAGSAGSVVLNSQASFVNLVMRKPPAASGTTNFVYYFRLAALPATSTRMVILGANGTAATWAIDVGPTGFAFTGYDSTGAVVATANSLFGTGASPLNQWIGMQLLLTTEGGNTRWENIWHAVGTGVFYTTTGGGSTYAGSPGRFSSVRFQATEDANYAGMQVAHAMITDSAFHINTWDFAQASKGYDGEKAGNRIGRLTGEESLAVDFFGDPSDTPIMGPQTIDSVYNLFQAAATVDGGILGEARDRYGLTYSTRAFLGLGQPYNFPYTASLLAATPDILDDIRYVVNDITAIRPKGSSRRSAFVSGGIGESIRPFKPSANTGSDDQLQDIADRIQFTSNWDEPRIPQLTVEMMRPEITTSIARDILALNLGSGVSLTALPSFLFPDAANMLVLGYAETIGHTTWTLVFNSTPRGPFVYARVYVPEENPRLDADQSTLNADITNSATSLVIKTPQSPYPLKWVDSTNYAAEFPFPIVIGGEVMTLTACTVGSASGSDWLQTATVTRSVNGVVKAQTAGSTVRLASPTYLGA